MTPKQIWRFFEALGDELERPATAIVTGAAAGALMGHIRPSLDVDFEIAPDTKGAVAWQAAEAAIGRATTAAGIQSNFAENIDRWGQITLLDYRQTAQKYRRYGNLTVRLMEPTYWAIGKLTRYLAPDVEDLVGVLKQQHVLSGPAIKLWAKALRASPRSAACIQFRQHVEHFIRTYGREVWGKSFNPDAGIKEFQRRAFGPPVR